MKLGESTSWARLCQIQAQWFTAVLDIGLLILIGFIITVMSGTPAMPTLIIIGYCLLILMDLIYLVATFVIMFMPPETRSGKWSFYHGFVVGYGPPFGLHLIGESSAWSAPLSPSLVGFSALCAFLGGLTFCASFIYWMMLAQSAFREVVNNRSWLKPSSISAADTVTIGILAILVLTNSACMLWIIEVLESKQAFTLVINTVAYLGALVYLYCVKVNYFTSFVALGTLAGVFTAISIMAAKWTLSFASQWLVEDRPLSLDLLMVALVSEAAMSLYIVPFLFLWKNMERRVEALKETPGIVRGEERHVFVESF